MIGSQALATQANHGRESSALRKTLAACAVLLWAQGACAVGAASVTQTETPSDRVNVLAERLVAVQVGYDPTLAYFTGLPAPDHSRFADRRPEAIRVVEQQEDAIGRDLVSVQGAPLNSATSATLGVLQEILESHRQQRMCKLEYWDLSHLAGWQVSFAAVAQAQPVDTPELRAQALQRWTSLPDYLEVQRANLRAGLQLGYSVPKSVVRRVIRQLDGLLATSPDRSPFYSLAARADDAQFGTQIESVIAERINPAIRRFRTFLTRDYLPRARDTLAVTALPDGARCYQALLRGFTTLDRTPAQIMAIGERAVAENEQAVVALGSQLYGTNDLAQIIRLTKLAPQNQFSSTEDLLAGVRTLASVAAEKLGPYFIALPRQAVLIEQLPDYQAGSGMQAHYEMQPDVTQPAKYIEPAQEWQSNTRGVAEVTLVHETLPGHHLQVALARELVRGSRLSSLSEMAAYTEGWARYAERLAEEAGIYQTDYARISRRIWPARGMVIDPAIHAFGWSREKALRYLMATGLFDEPAAQAMVDRIAVLPGQLTAYDTGGLEILSLRQEAQAAHGARFNIAQFHQRVLEQGIVPLHALREHVRAWIKTEEKDRTALIDRELLFADPEISAARLSPDGRLTAFLKPFNGTRNLWVKGTSEPFERARPLTASTARPLAEYSWSRDGKYLLYTQDRGGDENVNVYAVSPRDPPASGGAVPASRNLTPMQAVQAQLHALPKHQPNLLYVGLNDRDPAWHDLYKVELSTAKRTLVHRNDERITGWTFDLDGRLRLATREAPNGDTELLRIDEGRLAPIYRCTVFETCKPLQFHRDGRRAYLMTNRGAQTNLLRLALLDVQTGSEELVESDPENRVDVADAIFSPRTNELAATVYRDDKMRLVSHVPQFGADYEILRQRLPGKDLTIDATRDDRWWLVTASADIEPGETWLFDRRTKQLTLQFRESEQLSRDALAPMTSIRYRSSDGLEIPAYLTLPKNVEPENLPLVVLPHGGPWARDYWGYKPLVQFFANRGFAVLQPNFRGSISYGKSFLDAGNGQWSQKMQDDLTWGVKYLVSEHIADPGRVAIVGGSYGGYAALAGAAFTPDIYRAAVSICGPSNLITLLDSIPAYWESVRALFHARMGDPRTAAGRAQLERQSPLNAAAQIRAPLLVIQGANDPRVKQAESNQIVAALHERAAPVEYLVAPDEGHGFALPVNRLAAFAVTERFLAEHLGTRYQDSMSAEVAERVEQLTVDPQSLLRVEAR
jgi:uncharacterized protein (DUF885 family)/dipeptidyl aminopeptidase/acylaminoacyl peptidase